MRTFVALDFNDDVEKYSIKIINSFKKAGFVAKWTDPGNFHITLFFLGEQNEENVLKTTEKFFSEIEFSELYLKISRLGFFSKQGVPSVLWLGFEKSEILKKIFFTGKNIYETCNYKSGNSFVPHLTLGRLKKVPDDYREFIDNFSFERIVTKLTGITLYKSVLTKNGPVYTPLIRKNF